MLVISDTSPIIFFAKIEKLELLKELYSKIYLPTVVWEELMHPMMSQKENISIDIQL